MTHADLQFRPLEEVQSMSRTDILEETWNDFRGYDHASLRSVYENLHAKKEGLWESGMDERQESVFRFYRTRTRAVVMLMRYVEQNGPDVPTWEEMNTTDLDELQQSEFSDLTTEEADQYGERSDVQKRRFEIRHRLEDLCPGFPVSHVPAEVKAILSDDLDVSTHTIEKDLSVLRKVAQS
jgi:hypothetical protein